MKPASLPGPVPRSVLTTVLGWLIAIGGALTSVVSFFALLMILVGKDGARNSDVAGFFLVVVAPPLTAIAGVGLALRWRWAWYGLVAGLAGVMLWNAAAMVSHPAPTVTTTVSPGGTKTTVYREGASFFLPTFVLATGLLAVLLIPRVRREFTTARRPFSQATGMPESATHTGFPPGDESAVARGWRVGHQGRDQMYYEERHGGGWQRIDISGEMLMGRAHHVIYFPSAKAWERMPEWARLRRDEIIARIKSEFCQPDYEYAEDVVPSALPQGSAAPTRPGSARVMQRCTPQQMRALLAVVVVMLGFAGYMGWKVKGGWDNRTVTLPVPKASLQRPVQRDLEPSLFWFSLGIYGAASAGSLAFAGWLGVQGWKAWRGA